jgi:hypothetical protein
MNIIPHKQVSLILLLSFVFATNSFCQDIFLLEKPGTVKNHKYYVNDFVKLKTFSGEDAIKGRITEIRDSSIIVAYANEVSVNDIEILYRKRWGFGFLNELFLKAGGAYLFLLGINGVISSDTGKINKVPFIVAGSLIAAGIAVIPLKYQKIRFEDHKWRVKILKF